MSTVSFKVTKEMDLDEWKDHVLGSGGFSWEWWIEVLEFEDSLQVMWYEDADDPDSSETPQSELTYQEIADAASELAAKNSFVAAQLANDDFDADGMDQVLQYAFIGEVRYG
jgi:hypothetical protein